MSEGEGLSVGKFERMDQLLLSAEEMLREKRGEHACLHKLQHIGERLPGVMCLPVLEKEHFVFLKWT